MAHQRADWRYVVVGAIVAAIIVVLIWRHSVAPRPIQTPSHVQAGANAMKFDPDNPAMSKGHSKFQFNADHAAPAASDH